MTGSALWPSLYLVLSLPSPTNLPMFPHDRVTVTVSHMPSGQVAKSFRCSLKLLWISHSVIVVTVPIITIYFMLLYLPRYRGDTGPCCVTESAREHLHNRPSVIRSDTVCHTLLGRKWIIWGEGGVYSWLLHLLSLLRADWTHKALYLRAGSPSWTTRQPHAHTVM